MNQAALFEDTDLRRLHAPSRDSTVRTPGFDVVRFLMLRMVLYGTPETRESETISPPFMASSLERSEESMSIKRTLPNSIGRRKRNIPKTGTDPDYLHGMPRPNTKQILWGNVHSLMLHHWGKENLTRLSREAKIGPASCSRMKEQETSVGLEIVQSVAEVFGLQAWQILIPELDPGNPPVFVMSDAERQFYNRIRNALSEAATREPPHPYETANGAPLNIKEDRRVGGRRSTDKP